MADDPGRLTRTAVDRLVNASLRQRAAVAAIAGLRRTDLLALDHIAGRESVTPSALARMLYLSSGGTTAVVDRLVDAGLVERTPGTGRRDRVVLLVTDRGAAVLRSHQQQLVADVAALTADLTPPQREDVERYLARLADIAERHADRLAAEATAAAAAASGAPAPVLWG
ncbi:MAG TPA: MarR family transcriptional regulator [Solirubrobacteraceae bacterium]